jgi:hypothetical protein
LGKLEVSISKIPFPAQALFLSPPANRRTQWQGLYLLKLFLHKYQML